MGMVHLKNLYNGMAGFMVHNFLRRLGSLKFNGQGLPCHVIEFMEATFIFKVQKFKFLHPFLQRWELKNKFMILNNYRRKKIVLNYFPPTLFIVILLTSCHNSSIFDKKKNDNKLPLVENTYESIGNIIKFNGVENLVIGDSIEKLRRIFPPDNVEYFEGYGYAVSEKDSVIMLISCKDQAHITSIEFYSSKFATESGVYPGMPIENVANVYPNIWLSIDDVDTDEEYFHPDELTLEKTQICYVTSITFKADENAKNRIGEYSTFQPGEKTIKFNKNAFVKSVFIYLPSSDGLKCK